MYVQTAKVTALATLALFAVSKVDAAEYTGPGLSADLVMQDARLGKGKITGRYHFDRGGQRYDFNGKTKNRSLILNRFSRHLIMVSRKNRVVVDENRGAALALRFGDEPCLGYGKSIFLGSENRFGRTIQVWRCEQPKQILIDGGFRPREKVTVWFDTGLKHFIRMESSSGAWIELRNIRPGRQAPALFDAPSEFAQLNAAARIAEVEAPQ